MGDENGRLVDDTQDPSDVYDDEVSQGDLIEDSEELEVYADEEDLRRRSPHDQIGNGSIDA